MPRRAALSSHLRREHNDQLWAKKVWPTPYNLRNLTSTTRKQAERQLPRGLYWARWYRYVGPDGSRRSPRERPSPGACTDVSNRDRLPGPLTKSDAQKILDLLIAGDAGTYRPPDTTVTLAQVARDYLATVEPGWRAHTVRTSKGLIECSIIGGKLGERPVIELTEIGLQQFLNEHVNGGASRSKLSKILLYLRNILDHAVMKKVIPSNPARNPGYRLKAKSKKPVSERYFTIEECQRLLSAVDGADHLIFRVLIQLALRPEEVFALRPDLRPTCGTLFGAKAKDATDTQAQLRHSDPSVTLRHYQKSIPAQCAHGSRCVGERADQAQAQQKGFEQEGF
jgi:hypothetical protein